MAMWLKQLTGIETVKVIVGPMVDSVTADKEEGLTLTSGEVMVWKHGGTSFGAKNESSSATHAGYGMYYVTLDATDVGTLGQLIVGVWESGVLVARTDFLVVARQVYDSIVSGSDYLQVDVEQIDGSTAAATRLSLSATQIVPGVVDTTVNPTTTTYMESDTILEATADHYNGRIIIFTSGALEGQATDITDYALVGANGAFTMSALTEAPTNNGTFIIV
jgi:hypothetical protein